MSTRSLLLLAVLASPAVGCGSSRLDSRDAGHDTGVAVPTDAGRDRGRPDGTVEAHDGAARDATPDAGGLAGRHAFDVTLKVTLTPPTPSSGGFSSFPSSAQATLVLDATAGWLLVGAGGQGSAAMAATVGDTLAIATPVALAVPFINACNGLATLQFASLAVTVDPGGRLRGNGSGQASYLAGDVGYNQAFTATIEGAPDTTPPALALASAGGLDPLAPARFAASEPLPLGTKARLVGADGSIVDLSPEGPAGASPGFVTAFRVPFTLPFGATYQVALDQVADFAANQALPAQAPPLATLAAPALLTDGGFETTTGLDSLLISSTGGLPVISGTKSLYLPGGTWQNAAVTFRLAVHPGDKAVRFSYRVASMYAGGGFYGAIVIGSTGSAINSISQLPMGTPTTTVPGPSGGTLTIGPVSSFELALPDPDASEVALRISSTSSGCGLPPPPGGLIIDDVRAGG